MSACSRWLSEARVTPPDPLSTIQEHPGRWCQLRTNTELVAPNRADQFVVVSGIPPGCRCELAARHRWYRFAQPPATVWQPSGLQLNRLERYQAGPGCFERGVLDRQVQLGQFRSGNLARIFHLHSHIQSQLFVWVLAAKLYMIPEFSSYSVFVATE